MRRNVSSDKELLIALKRFCAQKHCFRNVQFSEEAQKFYNGTMDLIDQKLLDESECDADTVDAIVGNLLILLTNAEHAVRENAKKPSIQEQSMMTEWDIEKASSYLDECWQSSHRYIRMLKKKEKAEETREFFAYSLLWRFLKILKIILTVILVLCVLVWVSGVFTPMQETAVETKNLWMKVEHWFRYTVRKEELPVSFAQKWMKVSRIAGSASILALSLGFVLMLVNKSIRLIRGKRDKLVLNDWRDYQRIRDAFLKADIYR